VVEVIRVQGRVQLQMALFPEKAHAAEWTDKLRVGNSDQKLDPMVPLAQALAAQGDEALSFSDRAAIRTFCRRLVALIRLGDFILRDACYDAAEGGLLFLKSSFEATRVAHAEKKAGSGAFALTLAVTPALPAAPVDANGQPIARYVMAADEGRPEETDCSLVLSPSPEALSTAVEAFIDGTMALGSWTNSLFGYSALDDLVSPLDLDRVFLDPDNRCDTRPNTLTVIYRPSSNPNPANFHTPPHTCTYTHVYSVHALKEACEVMVEEDCDLVEEACRAYDSFAHELNANATYGNGLSHSALMGTAPKSTKAEIYRLLSEADRCKELPKFLFIGVLRCGLSELTSRYTRQTGLCHRSLSRLLPEVFLTQAEATIERCYYFRKTLNDSLNSKTTSLDGFIEVLGVYTTAVEEHDTLEACYKRDMGTMDVLETHKLPTTDAVRAKYKGLQNMWRGYVHVTTAYYCVTTAVPLLPLCCPSGMVLTPVLTYTSP